MNIINQDILSITRGIIAHQVNCQGVMGAGLAKSIRRAYPDIYFRYKQACKNDILTLGKVQFIQVDESPLFIANLAAQQYYGTTRVHTDYSALSQCLTKLNEEAINLDLPLYLPYKMSCGLGGGDWLIVSSLIEKLCPSSIICRLQQKQVKI